MRRGDRDGLDVRVLNLAFGAEVDGGSYRNDPLAFAVERAWDEGLTVVTSAGNGGADSDSLDSPAYDPYVIAVGAEDSGGTATLADDGMALFSSRGSVTRSPDVVAPGVAIVSTRVPGSFLDEAFPAARIGDGFRGSGTSQSAAVVSGAAALLIGERLPPRPRRRSRRCCARPPGRCPAPTRHCRAPAWSTSLAAVTLGGPAERPPELPGSPHRRLDARRAAQPVRGREPAEQPLGQQPLGRATAGRSNRWASNRWASNRWAQQPLGQQPLVERRMGRGFVMSGRKWTPSV